MHLVFHINKIADNNNVTLGASILRNWGKCLKSFAIYAFKNTGGLFYPWICLFAFQNWSKDIFLDTNGLFICEFKILGPKWRNVSTANNEGKLTHLIQKSLVHNNVLKSSADDFNVLSLTLKSGCSTERGVCSSGGRRVPRGRYGWLLLHGQEHDHQWD